MPAMARRSTAGFKKSQGISLRIPTLVLCLRHRTHSFDESASSDTLASHQDSGMRSESRAPAPPRGGRMGKTPICKKSTTDPVASSVRSAHRLSVVPKGHNGRNSIEKAPSDPDPETNSATSWTSASFAFGWLGWTAGLGFAVKTVALPCPTEGCGLITAQLCQKAVHQLWGSRQISGQSWEKLAKGCHEDVYLGPSPGRLCIFHPSKLIAA